MEKTYTLVFTMRRPNEVTESDLRGIIHDAFFGMTQYARNNNLQDLDMVACTIIQPDGHMDTY